MITLAKQINADVFAFITFEGSVETILETAKTLNQKINEVSFASQGEHGDLLKAKTDVLVLNGTKTLTLIRYNGGNVVMENVEV